MQKQLQIKKILILHSIVAFCSYSLIQLSGCEYVNDNRCNLYLTTDNTTPKGQMEYNAISLRKFGN